MANWALTDYVVEGPKETLQKLLDIILHPPFRVGCSSNWEGNILFSLGFNWDENSHYLRGFIREDNEPYIDTTNQGHCALRFSAEEAWGATDFHTLLEQALPDTKVYYNVELMEDDVYATNDKEGKYFPERFFLDTCINNNYDLDYFKTKEEAFNWLRDIIKNQPNIPELTSIENMDSYIEQFNEDYDNIDDFISFHKCVVLD